MEGDTVVDGRRHNIGWKEIYRWMEEDTQNRMKGDTEVDGRRHNIGWKEIQWSMEEDTT